VSFTSGTQTECFYAFAGAATQLASFTTEDNLQKTYPVCPLPGALFKSVGQQSSSFKIKAGGQIGFTTGSPTFLWSIRLMTGTTWSAGGVLLGATAATAALSSAVVTTPWFLEVEVTLRTLGIGATGCTAVTMGQVDSPAGLASPGTATIPSLAVAPTATLDNTAAYNLFLSCACGTSNSLNLINLQYLKVWGDT
jgi:hypothetical protein